MGLQEVDTLTAGMTLGDRYRTKRPLGAGGMCVVWLSRDIRTDRDVAVKVLTPEFRGRRDVLIRFDAEGKTMMGIHHRHVVEVYGVDMSPPYPHIAMEYCEGGTLADWVARHGPMPPKLAAAALMQVCKGVGAAHQAGVIHRDIKPHNVLVSRRGVCKVADFGVAQTDISHLTQTGHALGSLGFMAPEQRNDAKSVGPAADVYGLGATLYYLLTGRMAVELFVAADDATLLKGVHPVLVPLLLQATAYRAADRYRSGAEMAKALHGVQDRLPPVPLGAPALAVPPGASGGSSSPPPPSDRFAGRSLSPAPPAPEGFGTDSLPDYIDRSSLAPRARGFLVGVDDASLAKAEEARQRAVVDGVRAAEVEPEAPPVLTPMLLAAGGLLLVAVLALLGVVAVTWGTVSGADSAVATSTEAWYRTLDASRDVADDIASLGGNGNAVVIGVQDVHLEALEPQRSRRGMKLQAGLSEAADRLAVDDSVPAVVLRRHVQALEQADAARIQALRRARQAREGGVARALQTVGLVSEFPFEGQEPPTR